MTKYYVVDAFTDELFRGSPAGVCLLDEWPDDAAMQNVAAENNLAETAFLVRYGDKYGLRWFTPEVEIDLCGHATLASAFIITRFIEPDAAQVCFETISGLLTVSKRGDGLLEMDFPSRRPSQIDVTPEMAAAIGLPILEAHMSRDLVLLLENEQQVRDYKPNFDLIAKLPGCFAVVITAKGESADFVSRFFCPGGGVPEDPVTGSAHCSLIPFWSERLGKTSMTAKQLSKRGGTLYCEDCGGRVKISGSAVLYLQGEINGLFPFAVQ